MNSYEHVDNTHTGSIKNLDQPPTLDLPNDDKTKKNDLKSNKLFHSSVDLDAIEYIDQELATIMKPVKETQGFNSKLKIFAGIIIVFLIAVSWTGSTQFAKSTYTPTFHAPYFLTWYNTCFMTIIYPLFMVPLMCKKSPWRLQTFLRQTATIFGPSGFCLKSLILYLFKCILPFCILWIVTNYFYVCSLKILLPGTVTAVFSSSSCFVFILSAIFLKERIYLLRIAAVLICVSGIVLMGYSQGFNGGSSTGYVYVVLAALGSALYQVTFKRVMGEATGAQVALFLTLLGILNMTFFWTILLLMNYMEWEVVEWNTIPWINLNGTALLNMVFNYLVNFGISVTFPLFISLGTMVGMPLNAGVDGIFRGSPFGTYKILSIFLIVGGFLLMLIPDEKLSELESCFRNEVTDGGVDNIVERNENKTAT